MTNGHPLYDRRTPFVPSAVSPHRYDYLLFNHRGKETPYFAGRGGTSQIYEKVVRFSMMGNVGNMPERQMVLTRQGAHKIKLKMHTTVWV